MYIDSVLTLFSKITLVYNYKYFKNKNLVHGILPIKVNIKGITL